MVKGQRMVQYFRTLILIILAFAICTPPAFAGDISATLDSANARLPARQGTSKFVVKDSTSTSLMSVLSSGNVGIGTTGNRPYLVFNVFGKGENF